jgi:hypothetical protein
MAFGAYFPVPIKGCVLKGQVCRGDYATSPNRENCTVQVCCHNPIHGYVYGYQCTDGFPWLQVVLMPGESVWYRVIGHMYFPSQAEIKVGVNRPY